MTTTILDAAEQRATTNAGQAHATKQEVVHLIREEIGPQHYAEAQAQLPKLEAWITTEIRPFLDRLTRLAARGKAPLPQYVEAWFREINTLCELVPATIRRGVHEWETLTPPIWIDGRSIDINVRAAMVLQIRSALLNWDGVQGRLEILKTQIERYIEESGWPTVAS